VNQEPRRPKLNRCCSACGQLVWDDDVEPDRDVAKIIEQARADQAVALLLAVGAKGITEHDIRGCSPTFLAALRDGGLADKRARAARLARAINRRAKRMVDQL
jgi:hypothetical protein